MLSTDKSVVVNGTRRRLSPEHVAMMLRFLEASVTVGFGLAIYVTYVESDPTQISGRYLIAIAIATALYQIFGEWMGIYEPTIRIGDPAKTARSLGTWTLAFAILLALAFILKISNSYSRVWTIGWFMGILVSLLLIRVAFGQWVVRRAERGAFALRTVIVGHGPEAQKLGTLLCEDSNYPVKFLGFIDNRPHGRESSQRGVKILGNLDRLMDMIRTAEVDDVILALPRSSQNDLRRILDQLSLTPVRAHVMPYHTSEYIIDKNVAHICGIPMVEVLTTPMSDTARTMKWLEDRILGSLLLLFLAPLMILIAIAIKLESRGPIFFKQMRQGYNDSLFPIWKFRTMYHEPTRELVFRQATWDDPRITPIGRFLRRTSLDELPQFFNVLNGTMSLIGPRPHAPETKSGGKRFSEIVDQYAARHRVKPGITGLAQVRGWRGETDTIEKIEKRVEHDLYYIEHWSVWLDIWILVKTIWVILLGKNAY